MIYTLLYILFAIIGIIFYAKRKYSQFIVILFFILFSGYGFVPQPTIKLQDIAMFMCMGSVLTDFIKNKRLFSAKNDTIAKIIYLLLGYYTLITIFTVLGDRETLSYSIKVWRLELFYLAYFTFRKIPIEAIEKAFKPILYISAITAFFYLLQFAGITGILVGNVEEAIEKGGEYLRFRNSPFFSVPLIFYLLYNKSRIKFRYVLILLFAATIIFSQGRGQMIAVASTIIIYQLLTRHFTNLVKISIILGIAILLFFPIIQYRFTSGFGQSSGLIDEVKKGFSLINEFKTVEKQDIDGTFPFRMALFVERVNYLIDNPQYLLTGIGSIHEESPHNTFYFILGTNNEMYKYGRGMINTVDISFVSHFFRYGLIYLVLYFAFIGQSLKDLYKVSKLNVIFLVGLLLMLQMVIQSLGSDKFSSFYNMALPLLLLSVANNKCKISSDALTLKKHY